MRSKILVVVTAGTVLLASCSGGDSPTTPPAPPSGPAPVAAVALNPSGGTIEVGETLQLTATTRDASGNSLSGRSVVWVSSSSAVATVGSSGLVTGVSPGSTTITATSEGQSASVTVLVERAAVASVSVSPTVDTLQVGDTLRLSAVVTAKTGTVLSDREISWSSSDSTIAVVSDDGLLTAVSKGSVSVTATSEGQSGSASVTILGRPVASVEVLPASSTLQVGQTRQLEAILRDADGNVLVGRSLRWASSDSAVATIDSVGLVTGVAGGSATIEAFSDGVSGLASVAVTSPPASVSPIEVSVLDVGQGDAIWIENGTSRVMIDGGRSLAGMADFIEEKGLAGSTIDYMILTHAHADHYAGLREFFKSEHNITISRFLENQDEASASTLAELRDSIQARVGRNQLSLFDTDDPCQNGSAICTVELDGGALMHIVRPLAEGSVNNRSVGVKLVGPDSASFTMWLSGDAENEAVQYFQSSYGASMGLEVKVLKGNHHGSCNGVTSAWLNATKPEVTTFGVSSTNQYGHVHSQTKDLHRSAGANWLRSDRNGRIIFRSPGTPGSGYSIESTTSGFNLDGDADATAAPSTCSSS